MYSFGLIGTGIIAGYHLDEKRFYPVRLVEKRERLWNIVDLHRKRRVLCYKPSPRRAAQPSAGISDQTQEEIP